MSISVDGEIEEATLTFSFTEDESADFYPAIYYVDTENQVMTELENQVVDWEAKTVTATTTHFSGYVTLNKVEQDKAWNEEILYYFETSDKLDVAFVIDESNIVSSIDANKERLQLASKVMGVLPTGSRASVSGFANYGRLYQPLTYDINIAKNSLSNIINGIADKSISLTLGIMTGIFALEFNANSTNLSKTIMSKAYAGEDIVMEVAIDEAEEYAIVENEIPKDFEAIQDTSIETEISIATTSDAEKIVATISEATDEISSEIDAYVTDVMSTADIFEANEDAMENLSDASAEGIFGSENVLAGASAGAGLIERNKKIIVMITDAKGTYFAPTVQEAIDNGVTIYTVGLGDGCNTSLLESIARQTGGFYCHSAQIDSLVSEIQKMSSEKVDTLTDSDGDGISDYDDEDSDNFNNYFFGILTTTLAKSGVNMNMDFRNFFADNTVYNPELSKGSILFAAAAYEDYELHLSDSKGVHVTDGQVLPLVLDYFGFEESVCLSLATMGYNDRHVSEVGLGYRTVTYDGETKNIIAVIIRGTNDTLEEWASDFDVGDLSKFGTDEMEDWMNSEHHAGFDIPANRIMRLVDDYVSRHGLDEIETTYWITGHSRGAAIANIIGMHFETEGRECFTYGFATPNTTMTSAQEASSYRSIFNVVNGDDFVPTMPVSDWGFRKYGRTSVVSLKDECRDIWDKTVGDLGYKASPLKKDKAVRQIAAIISEDPRIEAYEYTCSCHGDGSDDSITAESLFSYRNERENTINSLYPYAIEFCKIRTYEIDMSGDPLLNDYSHPWRMIMCQTPAYYMQLIARTMISLDNKIDYAFTHSIAPRYEKSRKAMVSASSYLTHPHMTESYYVLSNYIDGEMMR